MRRRRLLLCLGIVSLTGLGLAGLVAWFALIPRPGITLDNYERLREGMTEGEVETLLGCPPGRYSYTDQAEVAVMRSADSGRDPTEGQKQCYWHGQDLDIVVRFDDAGKVCWKTYIPIWGRSFWDRLAATLPW